MLALRLATRKDADMADADRLADDAALQRHLAECVECWELLAEWEAENQTDLHLPEHPEFTTEAAKEAHSG